MSACAIAPVAPVRRTTEPLMVSVMRLILAVGGGKRRRVVEPARLDIGQWNCGEQLLRIGMLRSAEHARDRPVFDDLAAVQDSDVVTEHPHQRQVMADEHHGEAKTGAQIFQQQKNMRLGRDVEARDDLVGDDEIGLERERPRNAGALALTA